MINLPQYVIIGFIFIGTLCNAYCDKGIVRRPGVFWLRWHLPKWVHFNVVYGVLLVTSVNWTYWIPVVLVCWVSWNVMYRGWKGFIKKTKDRFATGE